MEPEWMKVAREKGLVTEGKGVNVDAFRLPANAVVSSEVASEVVFELMKTASEEQFQECVITLARNHGWRVAHCRKVLVKMGETFHYETPMAVDGKGFFDLYMVRDRIIHAELKVGKNKQTPEQKEWEKAVTNAGGQCFLWYPEHWPAIVKILTAPRTDQ